MRRYLTCAAMWVVFFQGACAQAQTVKLPSEIKGDIGQFIAIKAEADGTSVKFYPLDPGLSVFPADLLTDKKTTVVVAARAGRYRVLAWTAKGDVPGDPVVCTVIVGNVPPVPPGPAPPVPPTPDALTDKIGEALRTETDPDKSRLRQAFADHYRQAGVVADDATVMTWGDLFRKMGQDATTRGLVGKLPKVQAVVGVYLSAELTTDRNRAMAGERDRAKAAFLTVATALENAKE